MKSLYALSEGATGRARLPGRMSTARTCRTLGEVHTANRVRSSARASPERSTFSRGISPLLPKIQTREPACAPRLEKFATEATIFF